MAQHDENRGNDGAVELLNTNSFDGLAEAVSSLLPLSLRIVFGIPKRVIISLSTQL